MKNWKKVYINSKFWEVRMRRGSYIVFFYVDGRFGEGEKV